jgi:PEP-CTERM motif
MRLRFKPLPSPELAADFNFTLAGGGGGGVPEPATWAMMLIGFGIVGVSMRRRQKVHVTYA